jgi:hypothetical protein
MATPNVPENRHLTHDTSPLQQKMKQQTTKLRQHLQNRNQYHNQNNQNYKKYDNNQKTAAQSKTSTERKYHE